MPVGKLLVVANGTRATLPHRWGVVGIGCHSIHCLRAEEQWGIGFLQNGTSLFGIYGQWISFIALPRCWGGMGIGFGSLHRLTDGEPRVVDLIYCISFVSGSSGWCIYFRTTTHCRATHCRGAQATGW